MDDDTRSISVLITAVDLGDRLGKIVTALDDQSLPYSRYQVIFRDPGSTDGTSKRLRDLEHRRPNVQVLAGEASAGSAVEQATGDYVLLLGPDDLLFPDGLAALLATASAGHDLVLAAGGDSGPSGFSADTLLTGEPIDAAAPAAGVAVLAPFALVRRRTLLDLPDADPEAGFRQARVRLLRAVGSAAVCAAPVGVSAGPAQEPSAEEVWTDAASAAELLGAGDAAAWFVAAQAAAILERPDGGELPHGLGDQIIDLVQRHWKDRDPEDLPVAQRAVIKALVERDLIAASSAAQQVSHLDIVPTAASAEWSSGVLKLTVNGTVGGPADAGWPDGCRIGLAIRNLANGLQYDLPAESTLDASADGTTRFVAQGDLDISRAAQDGPLPTGIWQVLVRLTGAGTGRTVSAPVPSCPATGAIIDATPVSISAADGQLRLDVGARTHGFLGTPYQPAQAGISQTAAGALMTITAAGLAVRGESTLPGAVYLGSFRLPAVLRTFDGRALIECYVSGLAGVSRLDVKIGGAVREHLGLQLRIGAVGDMAVETAAAPTRATTVRKGAAPQPPKPKPAPGPAGAVKSSAGRPPGSAGRTGQRPGGPAKSRAGGRKQSGRVVNRLPEPLRPLARQVARSPLVRRVYRQVVRRG